MADKTSAARGTWRTGKRFLLYAGYCFSFFLLFFFKIAVQFAVEDALEHERKLKEGN